MTRVSPATGPGVDGTVVTITGIGFGPGDQVAFGTASALAVAVASATRIVAVSPPGLGPVNVTVTNVGGVSRTTTSDVFSYLRKPAFTSPATATATQGKAFSFTVSAPGYPVPVLTWSGKLPAGLRIKAGKGALVISGKPSAAGSFVLHLTARNSLGTAKQALTITVKR